MPIKLHNFGEPASIPKQSYFCQKLETYFRAARFQDYVTVASLPTSGPKRKLPYVTLGDGKKIADSHWAVREMIERGLLRDMDEGLSEADRADTRAWQSYIEETVFPANVVARYGDDKNWATFVSEVLGKLPYLVRAPLAAIVRRGALSQLWARGTGRYSKEEIAQLLEEAIKNIELRIAAHEPVDDAMMPWFVYGGSSPTSLDVILYSWLVCVLSTKCNPVQAEAVLANARLRMWVRTLTIFWFPEYEGVLKLTEFV